MSTAPRKEVSTRIITKSGKAVTVTLRDALLIDDLLINGMKAEGYRVMTGIDVFPDVGRRVKDYLIRIGVVVD